MTRLFLALLLVLASCATLPVENADTGIVPVRPIRWRVKPGCLEAAPQTLGQIRNDLAPECNDPAGRDLVTLSLSGGGVKATIFSGEALFYLQFLGLLDRVSVISSVSGGSFTAAVYALSCDQGSPCAGLSPNRRARPLWVHDDVMRTFSQGNSNVIGDQIGRLFVPFLPSSIGVGRFGYLIDHDYFGSSGPAFTFADLNPARPHLFLNATITSDNRGGLGTRSSNQACKPSDGRGYLRRRTTDEYFHFAFSDYYFNLLDSRLANYKLGAAVAASSAFPVLIDNAELHDWCGEVGKDDKIRLMDGGANDNQALVETYLIMAELVLGQHRSDLLIRNPPDLDRVRPTDRAFLVSINSAVTETTGSPPTGDNPPSYGVAGLLSSAISKSLAAIDVYSAEGYALRKQSYLFQNALLLKKLNGFAPIYPSEISITELDQYVLGGTEAALRHKAALPDETATDVAEALAEKRIARQQKAYAALVEDRAARKRLGLSDWHPQCYYDMRKTLDASLISLPDDDQACLREAARWAVALRGQEMCGADPADSFVAAPDGLHCQAGKLQPGPDIKPLGTVGALPGQCANRITAMLQSPPEKDADPRATCRALN